MMYNRKLAAVIAAVLVLAGVFFGLRGKPPARPDGYVADPAGAFGTAEQSALAAQCSALHADQGVRFYIAAVRTTASRSTAQYVETLWNDWGLGSYDLLLLMVTGKEDYYFVYGDGCAAALDNVYDSLLQRWLEPDFADGNYASGAQAFVKAVGEALTATTAAAADPYAGYYDSGSNYGTYGTSGVFGFGLVFVLIILFIVIVAASSNRRMRRYRSRMPFGDVYYPPRGGYGGYGGRPSSGPRPPRPPRASGGGFFGGSSFGGGFSGGGRSSSHSGFSGGGRSSHSGFSGGGRSGGFSGGGRSGGHSGGGRH